MKWFSRGERERRGPTQPEMRRLSNSICREREKEREEREGERERERRERARREREREKENVLEDSWAGGRYTCSTLILDVTLSVRLLTLTWWWCFCICRMLLYTEFLPRAA